MRSETEILDLILDTAENDDRVRAVVLNGSRADPNARRDPFQDFDILFVVSDVASFVDDEGWIRRFGELMILQMPEAMRDPPPLGDGRFAFLMQCADGNRIDLTLFPVDNIDALRLESLSVLLLDKDALFPRLAPPSDRDYVPDAPEADDFSDCCNEFLWLCPSVAKGLWRDEIPYAKHVLDRYLRDQLTRMLTWRVGVKTEFTRGPGKFGKHFEQVLEPDEWAMLRKTYSDADVERTWDALETSCALFELAGRRVADHFGFEYPIGEDERVRAHVKRVRSLPKNAKELY